MKLFLKTDDDNEKEAYLSLSNTVRDCIFNFSRFIWWPGGGKRWRALFKEF